MFTIYALREPDTEEIRYIGVTQFSLESRLAQHLHAPSNPDVVEWLADLQTRGLKPKITPLEPSIETWDAAKRRENMHISMNKSVRLLNFQGNKRNRLRKTLKVKLPPTILSKLEAMSNDLGVSTTVALTIAISNYTPVPFEFEVKTS